MNYNEFKLAFYDTFKHAISWADKARREGLLSLEEELENAKDKVVERDILFYGLRFVVDGTDFGLVDKILSNIVDQEKDEYSHLLKIVKKEAILSLHKGDNPYLLAVLLNSYTDLPLNDPVMQEVFNDEIC